MSGDLEAENKTLRRQVRDTKIRQTFDTDQSYDWHSADDAFEAANAAGCFDRVNFRSNGDVVAVDVRQAIRKFAQGSPHHIKVAGDGADRVPMWPSGAGVGSGRKKHHGPVFNAAALKRKYPAI